ncbi:thermonuclease family protein [Planctomicrobium piriforme]|uniref:Micrococcal nuclease n=1 Tax=Planctomicrobium piriforme TaxID=1576369 RepID=A0A1I3D9Y5_9PLAN|nr:thermonuclease family protein [Planctomicrobium piriforme]SFH83466.1 micrococcal nuclease [Planctomicrobium piriforme]
MTPSRRMRLTPRYRRPRILPALLLFIVVVLAGARVWEAQRETESVSGSGTAVENGGRIVQVRRTVDGDTLLLESGERVRLLGVDTPETKIPEQPPEPFGQAASDFTAKLVTGQRVRLEFDRERFDQYGRTLAYVYVGDLFLNEELIRQGLSPAQLQYPFRSDMKRRFSQAESAAKEERKGIWSLPAPAKRREKVD